jgi:hypothetical protein
MNDLFIDYTLHAKFDVQSVKYRHNNKDKKTEQGGIGDRELEKKLGYFFLPMRLKKSGCHVPLL